MNADQQACLACGRNANEIPLIPFEYQGNRSWICPQHLPVLIHDPTQLAGRLPGAEHMEAADHKD